MVHPAAFVTYFGKEHYRGYLPFDLKSLRKIVRLVRNVLPT